MRRSPARVAAGGVAQQARLDDLQGEGVIALADEGGGGGGELLVPAPGEQVERGGVPGRGGRLQVPARLAASIRWAIENSSGRSPSNSPARVKPTLP